MSQEGKVALVTGGAQGIGRAFVESLLDEAAIVAILDIQKDVGEATERELSKKYPGKIKFLRCDVTNDEQFEDCFKAIIQTFSHLDIVINNAGLGSETVELWKKLIEINFVGAVKGCHLGMKYMGKDNGGNGGIIVNIASVGALNSAPAMPIYTATKAAINQVSRSYGHDFYFKKSGVKVIALNPGRTTTQLATEAIPKCLSAHPDLLEFWNDGLKRYGMQNACALGQGLIEVLKKAENGSLWTIEGGQLPKRTILQ